MSVSSASRAARIWPGGRTTAYSLRHGLGVSALGLMLGVAPAYANGIEDLPTQQRLNASGLSSGHVKDATNALKATVASMQDSQYQVPVLSPSNGLAPELVTQMMMSANRQGMQQFSTLDVKTDHVQFTGWGRDGWEMTLSINLADGELLDESLRQTTHDAHNTTIDRGIMRQTLNFAASDGIEEIHSVDVDANAIRVQGKTHEGKLREISLNMPWLGHPSSLASEISHSVQPW